MATNPLLAAKRVINDYRYERRYHKGHINQATEILGHIESSKGKTSASEIRKCDQYAREILGRQHYAPWLYVYTAIAEEFKEGWIPDNFYGKKVVPTFKGSYGNVSSLKPLNSAIFGSTAFPDVISFVNGLFIDTNYNVIDPADVKDRLFATQDRVVFKPDSSAQGEGIAFFTPDNFAVIEARRLGNGLYQAYIPQHQLFEEYAQNSVATLRITTVITDAGEVSLRACYLRLGAGDDTHVKSKSHIRIPIDLQTGAFSEAGFLPTWVTTNKHPTSQLTFAGRVVPCFEKCITTVMELHRQVPYARCVGWDVVVDQDDNVRIMEWNGEHNDIKFSEAVQGPCFADLGWEKLA